MDSYFNRSEVSNSNLTALKSELSTKDYFDPSAAYAFGTLLDAMITEPSRINFLKKTIDGLPCHDFDKSYKMMKVFINDPKSSQIIKRADFQKVSIAKRSFDWNGLQFELDCRCKWDFFGPVPGDIKSTSAKTQKEFEAACMYFDYYRSRAWYMDIENTDIDIIIGISKTNFKLFYVPIKRGDDKYMLGKQQYTELAMKWWAIKDSIDRK